MTDGVFAIVAADFYPALTRTMLRLARAALLAEGITKSRAEVWRVPGALEIPFALKTLAQRGDVFAMAAIGCVVRGETRHFEIVADNCARGIMQVQLETGIPTGNGVLAVETMRQARGRAEKAADAVRVALALARLRENAARKTAKAAGL